MNFHDMRLAAARRSPAVEKYTRGYCAEFALALSIATDLPVVVLCDEYGGAVHALVETADGMLVDVRGVQNWEQIQLEWDWSRLGKCSIRPATLSRSGKSLILDGREDGGWVIDPVEVYAAGAYIQKHASKYCLYNGPSPARGGTTYQKITSTTSQPRACQVERFPRPKKGELSLSLYDGQFQLKMHVPLDAVTPAKRKIIKRMMKAAAGLLEVKQQPWLDGEVARLGTPDRSIPRKAAPNSRASASPDRGHRSSRTAPV